MQNYCKSVPISLAYRPRQTKIKDKQITINTKETNRYRDGEDHILHIDKNIILSNRTFMVIGKKKEKKKNNAITILWTTKRNYRQ